MPEPRKTIALFVASSHREVIPDGLRKAAEVQLLVVSGPRDIEIPEAVDSNWVACCRTPVEAYVAPCLTSLRYKGLPILGIGHLQSTFVNLILNPESTQQVFVSALSLLRSLPRQMVTRDLGSLSNLNIENITTLFDRATNMRLPGSHERSDRVVWLVIQVARQLGLSDKEIQELTAATQLREIGKIGLPDSLLYVDRSKLPAEGVRFYENYAAMGAAILRTIPALHDVATIVGYQLENVDGSGPSGIFHFKIPIGARILRACAVFERTEAKFGSENTDEILASLWKKSNHYFDTEVLGALDSVVSKRMMYESTLGERISPDELRTGMVLAQNIYSPTGVRMLAFGALVTASKIRMLTEHLKKTGQTSVIVQTSEVSREAVIAAAKEEQS